MSVLVTTPTSTSETARGLTEISIRSPVTLACLSPTPDMHGASVGPTRLGLAVSLPSNGTRGVLEALATQCTGRETGGVEPLPAGARTPPRPPRPPAPPTTGWGGQPSWNYRGSVVHRRSRGLAFLRESIAETRSVAWPSRSVTLFNARTISVALLAVGFGIAAVNLATGDAVGSLVH
jgi:preprotein translocase subunit SecE